MRVICMTDLVQLLALLPNDAKYIIIASVPEFCWETDAFLRALLTLVHFFANGFTIFVSSWMVVLMAFFRSLSIKDTKTAPTYEKCAETPKMRQSLKMRQGTENASRHQKCVKDLEMRQGTEKHQCTSKSPRHEKYVKAQEMRQDTRNAFGPENHAKAPKILTSAT
ncbi:hypothetical protein B9Z55_026952 [Caenorhabditis nigoni]|nr:hypothetical protein B9Z55_026952 [Caenorhabditis nigoni]